MGQKDQPQPYPTTDGLEVTELPSVEELFIQLTQALIAKAECARRSLSDPVEAESVADHFLQLIPLVADIRQAVRA